MSKNKTPLAEFRMTEETSENLYGRISCFLEKYFLHQGLKSKRFNSKMIKKYDLEDLCLSCYIQGLHDANLALKNNGLGDLKEPNFNTMEELTFGQKAVGLNFNPSNDDKVGQVKQKFAEAIDLINDLRNSTESGEVKRQCSVAITETQTAQMWAVKAITWKD